MKEDMDNVKNLLNLKMGIKTKIAIAIILTTILSSPISGFINLKLSEFAFFTGTIATITTTLVNLIVIVIVMLFFCNRLILNHLYQLLNKINEIADNGGDLTQRIDIKTGDELGVLGKATNNLIESINVMVKEIDESAKTIALASEQIYATTKQIAGGSQEQSKNTHELSAKMDELAHNANVVTGSISQINDELSNSNSLAEQGKKVTVGATKGMENVSKAVDGLIETIKSIENNSKVINDIAEQTNLLALNATIEAARAGEHGRGFAVVAEEVRKLSERTAQVTDENKRFIEDINSRSNDALEIVRREVSQVKIAANSFIDLALSVQEITAHIKDISMKIKEQAEKTVEANAVVQSMSGISEEFAASSEETAAAAQSLNNMAESLKGLIEKFKV